MNWKNYRFPIILIGSLLIGALIGIYIEGAGEALKPLGDIFLNLMFMIVTPLIATSIISAVANSGSSGKLKKIMGWTTLVFIVTGAIAALYMIVVVKIFPQFSTLSVTLTKPESTESISWQEQLVGIFTTDGFVNMFQRENMMALIVFSLLVGFAINLSGEAGKPVAKLMNAASTVMLKTISIVMYYAPIGLGAYFAYLASSFGSIVIEDYAKAFVLYLIASLLFFCIMFTVYAFIAGGTLGVKRFWKNLLSPSVTAIGTCSSMATLPVNLSASEKIGVSKEVRETVLSLGATMHKDGSVMGLVLKISVLFSVFHMEFAGWQTIGTAVLVAILGGTLMGAIPQGGMIAEMMLISLYGLPPEALPILAAVSTVIDVPATLLNATSDNYAAMLVARKVDGKDWATNHTVEEV